MRKIFIFMLMLVLVTSCACKHEMSSYEEKIQFPQLAQELHSNIPIEFDLGDKKEILGMELSVYKIIPRRDENNAEYYDGCLFKIFESNINNIDEKEYYTKYYCDNNDIIEIYNEGSFVFSHNRKSKDIVELSEYELVSMAENYLKDNALLPYGFVAGKRLGGTYNEKGEPLKRTIGFYREIDEYDVYGRSDITVEIDSSGVNGVYSIYSEYEFDRKVKSLSYDEILNISPLKEGQVTYEASELSGEAEYIIIDDVEIMYYDSPVNQPSLIYIQPIYKFTGKIYDSDGNSTDYNWVVQAVA